ncbi:hypothetical protein SNE40_022685 [Patella caerulea]|uniref:Vesicular, overexpressed in cancer, prosurvival protein 1 n=1 Tax=Patella caerulea TaxID=87958 RepID=A0AAN8G0Z1_PATCE
MEAITQNIVIFSALLLKQVTAYYCEGDKCSDDEYCCGLNTCCTSYKVWELWYFWFGLCFFLVLLSMCSCLWRYRPRGVVIISSTGGGYNYSPLHNDPVSINTSPGEPNLVHTRGGPGTNHFFTATGNGPPPYSASHGLQSHNKINAPPPAYADVAHSQKGHYSN